MRRQSYLCLLAASAVAMVLVCAPAVLADSYAASGGGGKSAQSEYSGTSAWFVEDQSSGGNQDIYYDPNAGPWIKTLNHLGGPVGIGQIFMLQELLHVGGGPNGTAPAWTDYHEEIRTLGWTWSPTGPNGQPPVWGFIAEPSNPDDLPWVGIWTYVVAPGNKIVDWSFQPPLPVCTNLTITKYLVYNGGGDPLAPVVIAQYPTIPEPGTLALVAVAGAILGYWGWRRRK